MNKLQSSVLSLLCLSLTACGASNHSHDNYLSIAGSTALLPLVKAEVPYFVAKHPNVNLTVAGGGSTVGLTQVASGTIDIGDSDIPPEGVSNVNDHKVVVVGFAMITNKDVKVHNLTHHQIMDIFSGIVTNWKQVGGQDEKIVVVNRPISSGTRRVFSKVLMGNKKIAETGLTVDASGTVVSTIESAPGAISYVGMPSIQPIQHKQVNVLAIDGVSPSLSSITVGQYHFWSYEHMVTTSHSSPMASMASEFIKETENNIPVIEQLGYIPLSKMRVVGEMGYRG
jgi:phosphate transport system substrate-binding protein